MALSGEDIRYAPMSLVHHNTRDIACLIYESAPILFRLLFGSQAITCLAALVARSHNRFSHQYIRVAETDQRVVGIVVLVPATRLAEDADYRDVLKFGQQLWLKLVQYLIVNHILQHSYPATAFYIGNLAVAAEYRNQGIGRRLLSHCIADAAANDTTDAIFISVDISNVRAQRLYESLGFQVVTTRTIQLFRGAIGTRVLSRSIPDLPREYEHHN